ncbi:hypothetical protein D3C87_1327620 [compost metagenome]
MRAGRNPALTHRLRHVEGAAKHGVGNGVETARRQFFGGADEVARGVVDQAIQPAVRGPDAFNHGVHSVGVADVDGMRVGLDAVLGAQPGGGFFHHGLAAATQMHGGAQRGQLFGHGQAQPRAAPRDEDALAAEQVRAEHALHHGLSPLSDRNAVWEADYQRANGATILQSE